jgi:oxygen-independent coproporphyrinogen-3 oxidase
VISLEPMLAQTPYAAYSYSYPHKTAYRPLEPPVPLRDVWARERRDALFLYLHVPFCEMRCGFCNLFTTANPKEDLTAAYLEALERQARRVREALGPASIARLAIGGGTPTYLAPAALHTLFDLAERLFGADLDGIPISVETSPRTAEVEKLRALRERGVDRISIGIQSFVAAEVAAAGRAQQTALVERALDRIREAGFPTLNIDLIYGLPGQTVASWLQSLQAALRYAPEELYLYPLYVRPLTGLERRSEAWDDIRLACYRAGRSLLLDLDYEQVSMRMFRRKQRAALGARRSAGTQAGRLAVWPTIGPSAKRRAPSAARRNDEHGPVYCCQEDGMVGLGCGARSYTRGLHYATEYAVGAPGVKAILAEYVARPAEAFDAAEYGCVLDGEEQRRRYVIQSLLQVEGLCPDAYGRRFGTDPSGDLPELEALLEHGLAARGGGRFRLTEAGLERSDAIGPWLYSDRVRDSMREYALR